MKVQRYKSGEERMLLTAMIVHDGVLAKIHRHFGAEDEPPFRSKWSNLIARWCFKYYAKYGKAPRKSIEGLFARYAQTSKDTESIEIVEKFLTSLDADYRKLSEEINEEFIVDKASAYFNKIRLERTVETVQSHLESDDVEEALKSHATYEKVDFASNSWTGFDPEHVKEALLKRDQAERLIRFPGPLGEFLSPYLKRTDFVAFAGPDKRGKSYWLQELVWRALKQRRKVLYYVLGDMSRDQVFQRLCIRMTRHPLTATTVHIPKRIKMSQDGATVISKTEERPAMTLQHVIRARNKLLAALATKDISLKIKCEGGATVAASDIEQDVKQFTKEGFVPDVVVVDYADLLAPEPHTKHLDFRHQNNMTWMILRRIAQNNHCLMLVATQTAATAYSAKVIRKGDFSEDKRKNAHVTGMIGINQTNHEKEHGLYRLNWIVLRGGKWSESQVVWTAGELALACPCFVSAFPLSKKDQKR